MSVIVVTFNRTELALQTLRSARAAGGGIDIEWHVVDSGSTEPVAEAVEREWPDVVVHRHVNNGFAAANNQALSSVRGRYVLLLNPDIQVQQGTLAELVSMLDQRPSVGMASVVQRAPDGALQYSARRDPKPIRAWGEALAPGRLAKMLKLSEVEARADFYTREGSADWLCGAFLIARAEVISDIGPMDDRFFLYSEETDWCYRCRRAGWEIRHLPVMTVTHHTSKDYSAAHLSQLSYSRMLFARKHLGRGGAMSTRWALAANHALRLLAFRVGAVLRGPAYKRRAEAESRALAVVLGRAAAPF